jgi:FMN-dependent NADH-azoreductase
VTRLLHVSSSPRGERSLSVALAEAFVAGYVARRPNTEVDRIDLWRDGVPHLERPHVDAKMAVIARRTLGDDAGAAWDEVTSVAARFAAADLYVLGVPMWNGGVPWILKRYIDTITQPGVLYRFDPATGYAGLLPGRTAVLVPTSHSYRPGAPATHGHDFHATYLHAWLGQVGIADRHELRLQPTDPARPGAARRLADAVGAARDLAHQLAEPEKEN